MPAINMPSASMVPADLSPIPANPNKGQQVLMSPFSAPTGSPYDAKKYNPTTGVLESDATNYSTGALSTGIGFGVSVLQSPPPSFVEDYEVGVTMPSGVAATTAVLTTIAGGHSDACSNGMAATTPYDVQPLLAFGNGASRDAGASSPYTGFGTKFVEATGAVAVGSPIVAGFNNRTNVAMVTGQFAFGSSTTASPAVTL